MEIPLYIKPCYELSQNLPKNERIMCTIYITKISGKNCLLSLHTTQTAWKTSRPIILLLLRNFEDCSAWWDIYVMYQPRTRSRDSVAGIATSYGLDDRGVGVRVPVGSRIFSSTDRPDRLWGSPKLLSNGYRGLFPRGVKWPGREIDHSPPTSADFKKMWIHTSTPIRLHGVVLN
jgi:hypothetical protein